MKARFFLLPTLCCLAFFATPALALELNQADEASSLDVQNAKCLTSVDPGRTFVILTDDLMSDPSGTLLARSCQAVLFEMIQNNALNTISGKEVPVEMVASFTATDRTQVMADLLALPNLDKFTLTLSQGRRSASLIEVIVRVERKR